MRILLFDPFHGASGDMIVGALLAAGADRKRVIAAMASVVATPTIEEVERGGIAAIRVTTHASASHRSLEEVLDRTRGAEASPEAIAMACRVFSRIHAAESTVHGKLAHFHEVGADDAIADVIGACTAIRTLSIDGAASLPIALGSGYIHGSHGTYPAPAPATVALLKGSLLQVRIGSAQEGELCTPTGAALLAEFCSLQPPAIPYTIGAVGYGAGSRNVPGTPNVLRAFIMDLPAEAGIDRMDILETNVDDVSGEVLSYTLSRLMSGGARDASATPSIMKKGRMGYAVQVIADPADTLHLAGILADELGTLGIRVLPSVHRLIAGREIRSVSISIHGKEVTVPVKCVITDGRVVSLKAEFEGVRAVAEEIGIPLREVRRIVENTAWERFGEQRRNDQ